MECPVCHGWVAVREDGTLFEHKRYADGAGYGPDQPHDLVRCEAGGWPVQAEGEHTDDYNARMEEAMFGPQDADLGE